MLDRSRDAAPPALAARLRRDTAAAHAAVEAQLDLQRPELSRDRYRALLAMFYGFYAPLEATLRSVAPPTPFALRERAHLIARDLQSLGIDGAQLVQLPTCTTLPRLARQEHAAGCIYVLEGACLGGQIIARAVKASVGTDTHTAFFIGEGNATAARWREVVAWLGALGGSGICADEVVGAARETFARLSDWAASQATRA